MPGYADPAGVTFSGTFHTVFFIPRRAGLEGSRAPGAKPGFSFRVRLMAKRPQHMSKKYVSPADCRAQLLISL